MSITTITENKKTPIALGNHFDFTKLDAFFITATKELVDYMLLMNTHNRPVKKDQVDYLAVEIQHNRWQLTGQGISITKTGWIADGQNRLLAIQKAGYPPITLLVVTGLEEKAQMAVDNHARRNQADAIKLFLNKEISTQMVSAINVLLTIRSKDNEFIKLHRRTSDFDVANFYLEFKDYIDPIMISSKYVRKSAVFAALIDYARYYDVDTACAFARQIGTGLELTIDMPAYRLRNWLQTNPTGGGSGQVALYSLTVNACINHALRQPIKSLSRAGSWDRLPKFKPVESNPVMASNGFTAILRSK